MRTIFRLQFFVMISLFAQSSFAQSVQQTDSLVDKLDRLLKNFQTIKDVSFDIRYTYSNESAPSIILDSLSGTFDMNGTSCHFMLDSTETIRNERYTIVLFHEDKIMYLTKGSSQFSENPVNAIAEYFKNNKNVSVRSAMEGRVQNISIVYPPGQAYKEITIRFDTVTGYIHKVVYLVQTGLLMEKDWTSSDAGEAYDAYARVEAELSSYRSPASDTSFLSEKLFFYKDGNQYKVTEAYKDFRIFIGSSNL